MSEIKVTIVVSPRERFSYTQQSLESIYQHTTIPFKLVYVDGNSPPNVQNYLETQAQEKQFQLIRTDHYLCPNHARNLALSQVDTEYIAFVDNDVVVSPGWLNVLINCAEETGATVVGPLMCQYEPIHQEIHFAGGEAHIFTDIKGRHRMREKMYKQGHKVAKLRPQLKRSETELCEFHCMLVRRQIFKQTGYFDEKMLNTKEHIDFCMTVRKLGGTVYVEPESLVTYVPTVPLQWSDLHYYMLRWSDAWELATLAHLRQKWDVTEDYYFLHKYKSLGWRRRKTILQPIVDGLPLGFKNRLLNKLLMYGLLAPAEKLLNRYLTTQYAKRWLNPTSQQQNQTPESVMESVTF